jgi:hypothetical protein
MEHGSQSLYIYIFKLNVHAYIRQNDAVFKSWIYTHAVTTC